MTLTRADILERGARQHLRTERRAPVPRVQVSRPALPVLRPAELLLAGNSLAFLFLGLFCIS